MCPPESAMLGARDVVGGVRARVVMPVVSNPAGRRSGAVKNGPENQCVLDEFVQPQRSVRQQAMERDGGAYASHSREQDRHGGNFEAGQRKKDQTGNGERMDQDEVGKHYTLAWRGFPKGLLPWTDFIWQSDFAHSLLQSG